MNGDPVGTLEVLPGYQVREAIPPLSATLRISFTTACMGRQNFPIYLKFFHNIKGYRSGKFALRSNRLARDIAACGKHSMTVSPI